MKKYFLLILLPAAIFSCDVKRKDKLSDDAKVNMDSLQLLQKQKEDSVAAVEEQKANAIKLAEEKAKQDEAIKNATTVQLIDSVYNFGTITEDEKVEYSYRFKNTGSNPLVIFEAHASCGCTIPEKPEKPILPGETGFIKVVFNSSGKKNQHIDKEITVRSNVSPAFPILHLTGEVKENQ
jgi:hypothetical protein